MIMTKVEEDYHNYILKKIGKYEELISSLKPLLNSKLYYERSLNKIKILKELKNNNADLDLLDSFIRFYENESKIEDEIKSMIDKLDNYKQKKQNWQQKLKDIEDELSSY